MITAARTNTTTDTPLLGPLEPSQPRLVTVVDDCRSELT